MDTVPTELIEDPDLLLEYMKAAFQTYLTGQKLQDALQKALSREEDYQSTIAEQASQIQKLTEKNGMLNESDIILKNNEELKSENESLKSSLEDAERNCSLKISGYRANYERKIKAAKNDKKAYLEKYMIIRQKKELLIRSRSKWRTIAIISFILNMMFVTAALWAFNEYKESPKSLPAEYPEESRNTETRTNGKTEGNGAKRTDTDPATSDVVYDYTTLDEITAVQKCLQGEHQVPLPAFPLAFSIGYEFSGRNRITMNIADESGNVKAAWNAVEA